MTIILFLLPVILNLSLLPFWFVLQNCVNLSIIETIINAVITPVYFTIIIGRNVKNISNIKMLIQFLVSFLINIVCCFMVYFGWGMSTGYFFKPDSETILICEAKIMISAIILTIGLIVIYAIKSKE